MPLYLPVSAASLAPYYVATADSSAIASTVTETAFSNAPSAFAAGQLTAGTVLRMRAWGTYGITGTPTLTFRWRMLSGTVSLMLHSAFSAPIAGIWRIDGTIIVRSAGASGSLQTNSRATRIEGNPAPPATEDVGTTTATVDTTASQTLQLTAKWSAASPSNTITCTGFVVEKLQ